jgi:hypothetical protein
MLIYHLCFYGNIQRKNFEVRSYEVSGQVCDGGVSTPPAHTHTAGMANLRIDKTLVPTFFKKKYACFKPPKLVQLM